MYNPAVVKCVSDFFKIPDELNRTAQLSDKIRSAAYSRIEEAKQRTKEELRKNLSSLLEGGGAGPVGEDSNTSTASPTKNLLGNLQKASRGGGGVRQKVWDIAFELSAPQILLPEHFIDKEALIMVLDFGKLHVKNDGHEMIVKQQEEQELRRKQQMELSRQSSEKASGLQRYFSNFYREDQAGPVTHSIFFFVKIPILFCSSQHSSF